MPGGARAWRPPTSTATAASRSSRRRPTRRRPARRSSSSTPSGGKPGEPGWPRYDAGDDATFNGAGNHGYGAYGENVGIGHLDDDPQLEVVVTFDNHQINVFNHDGTSVLASPWFTNRESALRRRAPRLGPVHPLAEPERGGPTTITATPAPWPDVRKTPWLQWTASPPSIADLDRDGRNEVIGLPNVERRSPYETQAYAFMVLDGAQGGGARRPAGTGGSDACR